MPEALEGVFAALMTPYDERGEVDHGVLQAIIDFELAEGLKGFFVTGGTGEGLLLEPEERMQIVETVVQHVDGCGCVIVHAGALSTRQTVNLVTHAESAGADVVAVVPPVYYKPDREGMRRHYGAVAEAVTIPWIGYHIPAVTGTGFDAEIVTDLLTYPHFAGLKFSDFNLFAMRCLLELAGGRMRLLSGFDEMFLPALVMGAHGSVGTTQNFLPRQFVRIFESYQSGDLQTAREMQFAVDRVIHALLPYGLAGFKEALRERGFDCRGIRSPITPLSEDRRAALVRDLKEAGFYELVSK